MNTNTQPSEHAIRAALIQSAPLIAMSGMDKPEAHDMVKRDAHIIDQHAIAPAVAGRDKRIAELVEALQSCNKQLAHTQLMASRGLGAAMLTPDVIARCEQVLAKHGGGHE